MIMKKNLVLLVVLLISISGCVANTPAPTTQAVTPPPITYPAPGETTAYPYPYPFAEPIQPIYP